ncbi:hypothetical protein SprV_0100100800 [Sparganum proliferum]
MADEMLERFVKAMERNSTPGGRQRKPDRLTAYDNYDPWEDRMKVHQEAIDEEERSAAISGRLDNEVYAVASAANLTASLTPTTIFQRPRRGFGQPSMPWVARAALRERRQLAGESIVDFLRHLRVLVRQAFPNNSFAELEVRILENFVDGIALPEIRRQFIRDPPNNIKVALDTALREEAIQKACPPEPQSPSMSFRLRPTSTTPQGSSIDIGSTGQRQTCDVGTQTARWQWGPPQSLSLSRRAHYRQQRGRQTRPQYTPGDHRR